MIRITSASSFQIAREKSCDYLENISRTTDRVEICISVAILDGWKWEHLGRGGGGGVGGSLSPPLRFGRPAQTYPMLFQNGI